uniref:PCI domain-containing protein n=1 Tax=Grammatophora oceanica TaxID=210454 RepID=A0A7S1VPM7_9STRA|mmetsp:Transcript_50889/g.76092  ORF Transcript_50889/g.76092 Transcript_50889/m.76092 type:complete len:371 (+) Transcript_50889:82-1194(+)
MKLMAFLNNPTSNLRTTTEGGTSSFLAIYDKVVLAVEKKLNPLSLSQMASLVADSLAPSDGTAAVAVLENLLEKDHIGSAGSLYLKSRLGLLQLNLLEKSGATPDVDASPVLLKIKEQLKANKAKLDESADVSTKEAAIVHSAHHLCGMKYRKAVGPPEAFYAEAIEYLHYTSIEKIPNAYELATDLSLAALTGDGVYNLGQVVTSTPLLGVALPGTDNEYLLELLQAMAAGHVADFNALSSKYASKIQAEPSLMHRRVAVQEKMTLLALVTMIWEQPASERTWKFDAIRERLLLGASDDVEMLVMRALSLHLIEGSLDQVSEELQVTWVMPRVLTKEQMSSMSSRFGEWAVKVSNTRDYMSENTQSLFA